MGIKEWELLVLTEKRRTYYVELDHITVVVVCRCLYARARAHKLLLKAPTHFHTLSIIYHFLLCVSILKHQINETPAMSLPLPLMSTHHNRFSSSSQFFPKINLSPPCISFFTSSVAATPLTFPFLPLHNSINPTILLVATCLNTFWWCNVLDHIMNHRALVNPFALLSECQN